MEATYFDTAELSLIRWGITMRRRTGGSDAGWHCKLPVLSGNEARGRDEVRMPLDASTTSVPPELADIVAPLARGLRLEAVATVRNTRTPSVISAAGRPLVEVVSDAVVVVNGDAEIDRYREIEIEAIDPTDTEALALMDALADALIDRGAVASSVSKAAAALGGRAGQPADIPDLSANPDALAVDVLRSLIAMHARQLLMADVGVRRDLPDSVHQMRVACRRLRSILRTFAPILDPAWADPLREELAWMANELGMIRDTEVLLERLDGLFDELPEPHRSAAHEAVDPWLKQRLVGARSSALAALRSDRHDWLIDDLVEAVARPGVTDAAYVRAQEVLPDFLHAAWKRLHKRGNALKKHTEPSKWHEARIAAKRARYTAEGLAPFLGDDVAAFASRLKGVTETLGEHQDADIAAQLLVERSHKVSGAAGFALGLAHERELAFMVTQRTAFLKSWKRVRNAARKAGA
jgi:CHAD domain-containing protein